MNNTIIEALEAAQRALNLIPRTRLNGPQRDSYEVASIVDRALKTAKEEVKKPVAAGDAVKSLGELLTICRYKCSPNDEVVLPDGRTNHEALIDATAIVDGIGAQSRGNGVPRPEQPSRRGERGDGTFRLCEAVADIAFLAGENRFYTGDSRADMRMFISWAEEFETLHPANEGDDDYIGKIERFTGEKIDAARSAMNESVTI